MPSVKVDVSIGELVDKITVLEIKAEHIKAAEQRSNVERELELLRSVAADVVPDTGETRDLIARLKKANEILWNVVDDLHTCEAGKDFGPGFVELARTAYLVNDERADIKRAINHLLKSTLVEEKFYTSI